MRCDLLVRAPAGYRIEGPIGARTQRRGALQNLDAAGKTFYTGADRWKHRA
jgi:hypothetical protein